MQGYLTVNQITKIPRKLMIVTKQCGGVLVVLRWCFGPSAGLCVSHVVALPTRG